MARFSSFVVLAGMRTGSNFLEANLNALEGVTCHGEAFNPHFIGYPNRDGLLGISQAQRDDDPARLLSVIRSEEGLNGFRYFHDHDPRVLPLILADPGVAKIVLTRNPVESYVSRKIASQTGQWKLTNVSHAKQGRIRFSAPEFSEHLEENQSFQLRILGALQRSGQTAFYLDYEDLQDLEVLNGLAEWLGVAARLEAADKSLKKQNPDPLSEKVANYADMGRALAEVDAFALGRTPNFEPRKGPAVPSYMVAAESPLLYLPMRGGPEVAVLDWLAALDGGKAPRGGFTQKTLRQWKTRLPGHRSFTVLRHPLARAHSVFCSRILSVGPGGFGEIRSALSRTFGLALPDDPGAWQDDPPRYRDAFAGFLSFLKGNLNGQTALRVDPHWASQSEVLRGFAAFLVPDMILREETLHRDLALIAAQVGRLDPPEPMPAPDPDRANLEMIVDDELEELCRAAYQKDYVSFGFGPWRG